jgi:predicted exporter
VLLALLGIFCASRFEIDNSIAQFIPSRTEAELVDLSLELVQSPLARRMLLSISGQEDHAAAAAELVGVLRAHPEVAWVEAGPDEEMLQGIYELYFPRRVYLASDSPSVEIPEMLEPEALEERASRLKLRLARPDSVLASRTAPDDPLGLFERILERIGSFRPISSVTGASSPVAEPAYSIIQLGLRAPPFDSARQVPLLADIEREFARINAARGGGLVLEQSGVNRFAVASERSVQGDLAVIATVSFTVVCGLFLLVFRSLGYLIVAMLPPLGGLVVAMAVTLLFDGKVHGITLGFGFALIGVAIDYPIHVMNHAALWPADLGPRHGIGRIRASLLLSGLTTMLAFLTFSLSEFPGLGEMGTFAATGLVASLALTLVAVPAFLGQSSRPTAGQRVLNRGAVSLLAWLRGRRHLAWGVVVGFAMLAALGVPQVRWEDDPGSLMVMDPHLRAEAERVQRRVTDFDDGRFVVCLASDAESVLRSNDRVYRRLRRAVEAGHLEDLGSLHAFLWSQALQRENLEAFRSVPDLGARIDRAFSATGFRPAAFGRFEAAVNSPEAPPLRPEDFHGPPLSRLLDSLFEIEGRWAAVTYLRAVRSAPEIAGILSDLEGVHYVDQKQIIAEVYQGYRRSTVRMLVLGGAVVFLVLGLRYRSIHRGLLASLPALLGALATLGVLGVLGIPVNVVGAISLLIVLGMGVDYGVFAVDGAGRSQSQGATLSSLLVSCVTSVFVLGVLALSEQPVLRAIGLSTATGVCVALALSPAVLVLAAAESVGSRSEP